MNIYAYSFSKKANSTAVPSSTGSQISVSLKNGTSKYYPIFELSGAMPDFSFIKWDNRYYFVDDIVQISAGMYDMHCSIDPLGTWRTQILSMNTYVNRSASDYNTMIKDSEVGNEQKVVSVTHETTSYNNYFDGVGCYIIRLAGGDGSSPAGVGTYVCNKGELAVLLNFMVSGDVLDAAWDTVVKSVFNPFQYILSLKWCALSYTTMTTGLTKQQVKFGWWTSTIPNGLYCLTGTHINFVKTLVKPSYYYSDFRKFDPAFSKYSMVIPGCGSFDIPSIDIDKVNQAECCIDYITLKTTWYIRDVNGSYLYRFEGIAGAEIQMSQTTHSLMSGVSGVTQAAISAAMQNPLGIASGLLGAAGAIFQPNPSSLGSNGSVGDIMQHDDIEIIQINYGSTAYPANYGRMLNQNRTLSSLSGFTKCPEASVTCDAPESIKSKINSYMYNGFYIE